MRRPRPLLLWIVALATAVCARAENIHGGVGAGFAVTTGLADAGTAETVHDFFPDFPPAITNNTIAGPQIICFNTVPAPLTGSVPGGGTGTYTYQWQSSTTSATAGFSNIGGATGQGYTPGALTATRWYRRIVGSGGLFDTTAALQVTVSPVIASNTISAAQTICYNSIPAALTGSVPTGGDGVNYVYQWQSSPDNSTWSGITGANGQGYTPAALTATTYFRRVVTSGGCSNNSTSIKITVTPVITTNTITADQSICSGQTPLALNGSTPGGGTGAYTYLWQSSTSSSTAGFATATGTSNGKNYSPAALAQTTWFRRVVSSGGCSDTSATVQVTAVTSPPGNPSVFGDNVWNVYGYSDNSFTTYAGYYTEPALSFLTSSRYTTAQSPSSASGYQGCLIPTTNFSVSFKRTDFTPNFYQIDLTAVDDNFTLIINGVQVYTRGCCVTPPTVVSNLWTGYLGASDQVEIRWTQASGPSQAGANFTVVTPAPINAGTIGNNESVCYGEMPYAGFSNLSSPTSGCTLTGYQWQSSIDSVTWVNISGATALTYTETSALTQTKWYRRVTTDACHNSAATLPVKVTVNVIPPGDPTVFGDNTWNAYAYQYTPGNTNFSAATYKGYYTEPSLSFDSRTRWANGTSPSNASGYQGCYVAPTYHWMSYKRTDFAPATYQIDIPAHDDDAYLFINGTLVFSHIGCCDSHTNVWTGPLGASDQVEFRVMQGTGGAYGAITLTAVTPAPLTAGSITASQTICAGNVPPAPFTQATAPTGGCTIKSYQWEYSTDNGTTWTAISGATASSFTPTTSVYTQTLYHRIVYDVCGNAATSQPDTVYMNNSAPGNPSVYGNNTWNVYCYQDVNFSLYAGYYTEPSLTFTTTSRYSTTSPPSAASGYQGCQLINTYYSTSMKRTGFTSGTYQIDITNHDDDVFVYIDGTLVFSHIGCCDSHTNIWTGTLNPTDQVEIRWRNNAGPGQLGMKFTLVSSLPLNPGTISAYNPNLCSGDLPIINNVTAASGGCPATYSWQSSTDGGSTWTGISGATGTSYTASVSPTTNIQYRRVVTDACGTVAYSDTVSFIQGAGSVGNPSVYGNGVWNVYAYNANGAAFTSAAYMGYYTEPLLSFNSLNRWGTNNAPSDASGYQGCQVDPDNHWVSYRRTNFTPGTYQIDITNHDDDCYLYINGVLVFSHIGCCDSHTNVWTGTLGASDQVEFRWREFNGGSNGGLNLTLVSPSATITGGTIGSSEVICNNTTPAAFTNTDSAHSSCYIYYQWQSQPNCSGGWTNVSGATGVAYAPTALTTKTCFRRMATNACGNTAYSNTITVDIYAALSSGSIASNQTICSGSVPAALTSPVLPSGGDGSYVYQWQSSTDNIVWTNIAGATSATYAPGALAATTYYRRNVTSCASTATSGVVTITVNPATSISVQPANAVACSGGNTSISVTATGTSLTYQWQVNTGSTWSNVTNNATYSGATTNNLSITGATAAMNGYQYRVIINSGCTAAVTSNTVTLTISATPSISSQPVSKTFCAGSNANFSVTASGSGLTYQWQQKIGAGAWTNLSDGGVYSGTLTSTLVLTAVPSTMNGYTYQCIINSSCAGSVTTSIATLTVVAAITNTISADQAVCSGSTTVSNLTGTTGGGYTYLWQSSNISGVSGFVAASGTNNGANYNPNPVSATTWYQRLVTNAGCSSTSNVVTITVNPTAIAISAQPAAQSICAGGNATFSVTATGPGTLSYQWYEYNGSVWNALTDGVMYSGSTSSSLTITGATAAMNGYRYMVKIYSSGCTTSTVSSSNATLTTNNPATITASNPDVTACSGNTIAISVSATGLGLTYQWQQNTGSGWNNLSNLGIYADVNTNSLRIYGVTAALNGPHYRCVVTGSCSSATSGVTNLTVNTAISNNSISNSQTLCAGTPVPFTGSTPAGGDGVNYTYQWQQNTGSGWSNISGANAINYAPGVISQTTQFLRNVSSGVCASNNSIAITVTITPPTSTSDPRDTIICAGINAAFTVSAVGTNLSYQWQVNSGSGFNNITNGVQYTGTTAATLNVLSPAYAMNGYQYRCVVSGNCTPPSVISNYATLTVNPVAVITSQPANVSSCQGSTVSFSVAATGSGLIYQWEEKIGSGSFAPITNGGIYSGASTATLVLTGISTAMNNNQYLCVVTQGSCPVNSTAASLSVNQQPSLVISNPATACSPSTIDITAAAVTAGSNLAGGTLTYWNDIGFSSALSNPSSIAVSGTYYIRVATSPACYDIKPVSVAINPVISNNIISAAQTICTGSTAALLNGTAVSGGNGTYAYQWQSSPDSSAWSNIGGAVSSTYNPGILTSTTYYRRIVTSGTCSNSASAGIKITVSPYPTAVIAYSGSPYCPTGTATVTQTGQSGGTYSSTAGLSIDATTGAVDLVSSTAGTYTVTYIFSNGTCSSSTTAGIVINAQPNVVITNPAAVCSPGTADITAPAVTAGSTSGLSYTYYTDALGTTTLSNPNAISTSGTYYIKGTAATGCSDIEPVSVVINAKPGVVISNPAAVCAPGTVDITAASVTAGSTGGLTYTYYTNSSGTTSLSNPNSISVSGTYYIKGTAATGCSDIRPVTVTINPLPAATIAYSGSPYCPTGTANVTQTGQGGGTYNSTAGLSIDATTGAVDLVSSTPGTYTVTYSFSNGTCSSSTTASIVINAKPNVVITNPAAVCSPNSVNLTLPAVTAGSTSGLSYTYYTDASGTTALSNPNAVSTSGTYYIKGTAATGCSDIQAVTVTINPLPAATIAYSGSPYCPTGTANVTQTGQGGGTYNSTAGLSIDATTGTVDLVSSTPGTYTVTYSFSNGTCSNSTTASIVINAKPNIVITNPAAVCSPGTVDITAASVTAGSASGLTYTYYTDALGTMPLSSPNAISASGTYYIKGTAVTGCSDIQPVSVVINAKPGVVISNPAAVCSPNTVSITAASVTAGSTGGLTYSYYTNSSGTALLSNPNSISVSGTYYIKGTAATGCSDIQPVSVTINPLPIAAIAYGGPYCTNGTATVTLVGQAGGVFASSPGLSIDPSTGTLNLTGSIPGTYTVTYFFNNGVCSNSTSTTVVLSNPGIVVNPPSPVCMPQTIDLTNSSVTAGSDAGLTFYYYTDGYGTTTLSNPDAVGSSGTYYIRGMNTSTGCQTNIAPVTCVINSKPSITVASDSTDICKGSSVTLTANSPGNTIEWLNVGTGSSVVVNPLVTTQFTAVASTAAGCTDTATVTVQVKKFSVSLTANPDPVLAGNTVTLNTSANFNYTITAWMPQMNFTDQTANSQSFILSDTSQTFSVIAQSDEGCLDTASITVQVNTNKGDFFIPNAFTPNNDGRNDVFKVYGSSIKEMDMRIFNQWGGIIFETRDPQSGWDGNYNGNPQPIGVYLYVVRVVFYDNTVYTKKGTINLIR